MGKRQLQLGFLALAITALSWGGMFQVVKYMLATLDAYYVTALRFGFAGSILLVTLLAVEGRDAFAQMWRDPRVGWLWLYGTTGFAGYSLFTFSGLSHTSPQQASVISNMQPLIVALILWLMRGVRPAPATLACVALAFAGCIVVVTKGNLAALTQGGDVFGNGMVFFGATCWVIYTLGAAHFRDWSPLRYTALSCALGTLSILCITALATVLGYAHMPNAGDLAGVFWPMTFLVVMSTVLAAVLWNLGVKTVGPLNATLFANFVPVVVFAIGIVEGQQSATMEYAGAAMVLTALFVSNLLARRALKAANGKLHIV